MVDSRDKWGWTPLGRTPRRLGDSRVLCALRSLITTQTRTLGTQSLDSGARNSQRIPRDRKTVTRTRRGRSSSDRRGRNTGNREIADLLRERHEKIPRFDGLFISKMQSD